MDRDSATDTSSEWNFIFGIRVKTTKRLELRFRKLWSSDMAHDSTATKSKSLIYQILLQFVAVREKNTQ